MKVLHVRALWESTCEVEVPDDYDQANALAIVVEEQLSPHSVDLVDWRVE